MRCHGTAAYHKSQARTTELDHPLPCSFNALTDAISTASSNASSPVRSQESRRKRSYFDSHGENGEGVSKAVRRTQPHANEVHFTGSSEQQYTTEGYPGNIPIEGVIHKENHSAYSQNMLQAVHNPDPQGFLNSQLYAQPPDPNLYYNPEDPASLANTQPVVGGPVANVMGFGNYMGAGLSRFSQCPEMVGDSNWSMPTGTPAYEPNVAINDSKRTQPLPVEENPHLSVSDHDRFLLDERGDFPVPGHGTARVIQTKVKNVMYLALKESLAFEERVIAKWLLLDYYKNLPYDRLFWNSAEKNKKLHLEDAESAAQVSKANSLLLRYTKQVHQAVSDLREFLSDPMNLQCVPADLTGRYLDPWTNSSNGNLLKKLVENDKEVRSIRDKLPISLNSTNIASALQQGGLLIRNERAFSRQNSVSKFYLSNKENKEDGTPNGTLKVASSTGEISYHPLYFSLSKPGAADTRTLQIDLPDSTSILAKRSRCGLAIPSCLFEPLGLSLPKLCVHFLGNGIQLLLFYRGTASKQRQRGEKIRNEFLYFGKENEEVEEDPTEANKILDQQFSLRNGLEAKEQNFFLQADPNEPQPTDPPPGMYQNHGGYKQLPQQAIDAQGMRAAGNNSPTGYPTQASAVTEGSSSVYYVEESEQSTSIQLVENPSTESSKDLINGIHQQLCGAAAVGLAEVIEDPSDMWDKQKEAVVNWISCSESTSVKESASKAVLQSERFELHLPSGLLVSLVITPNPTGSPKRKFNVSAVEVLPQPDMNSYV